MLSRAPLSPTIRGWDRLARARVRLRVRSTPAPLVRGWLGRPFPLVELWIEQAISPSGTLPFWVEQAISPSGTLPFCLIFAFASSEINENLKNN